MTNEIKEILNDLQRVADRKCYPEDILDGSIAQEWVDYIEDYITNLQEEKQRLLESADCLSKGYSDLEKRIDKAIEYIETHKEPLHHYFDEPDCDYWIATNPQDIIDILRGDE